jgi:small redox-active disulfide protein 2
MNIQVLGSGCPACKQLFETVKKAAKELGVEDVEYVNDINLMIEMGIMQSPAIAINGKPVLAGGGYDEEKIKKLIKESL